MMSQALRSSSSVIVVPVPDCWLFVLTSYPAFYLMAAWPSLAACVIAVGWLQLLKAGYSGVLPSLLSEQFPVETRAIGVSLSYTRAVTPALCHQIRTHAARQSRWSGCSPATGVRAADLLLRRATCRCTSRAQGSRNTVDWVHETGRSIRLAIRPPRGRIASRSWYVV
jgi:hypothetical protein